jgi:hypothetical protein
MSSLWSRVKPYVHPDPNRRFPQEIGPANIRPYVFGALIFYAVLIAVLLYLR